MIVGPWGHGASQGTGELDFGEHAYVDERTVALRWYDYWLKGIDNGLVDEPPVKLFLMGKNVWRFESEYPLARTQYKKMYFQSQGSANSVRGDGKLSWAEPPPESRIDRYIYDPGNPVPSLSGNNCCGTPTPTGPRDQRPIEGRRDILIYTSDFLGETIEVTGR